MYNTTLYAMYTTAYLIILQLNKKRENLTE